MTQPIRPPCDVCGNPSTNAGRNLKQIPSLTDFNAGIEWGVLFYGCAAHPVLMRTIRFTDPDYHQADVDTDLRLHPRQEPEDGK